MFKKFIFIVLVVALSFALIACGGGGSDSTSSCTGAGCSVVEDVLNAGAHANGDGQVDTTPCNGIVCP